MRTLFVLLALTSTFAHADTFGTPDQDKIVRRLREQFSTALPTFPASGFTFESNWACRTYNAFKDDFYNEPDATLRLVRTRNPRVLASSGNMIFKEVIFTDRGLQSVQENEAYGNEPLFMTIRPYFTSKSVRLIGEVSVKPSMLKSLAYYYGYAKPFTGVSSIVDPSKTVFYYFSCAPVTAKAASEAEARSRTWSIPAELSRRWPGCTDCR